jgi:hypothetical protein
MHSKVKIQRIQNKNRARLQMFGDILKSDVLHHAVPRIATANEGRLQYRNMLDEISAFGKYCRANGFDPTRTFQHVASIDSSVWSAILEAFAKHNEQTGELEADGLLYKTNEKGTIVLNRDFFYALIDFLEKSGYPCDMRGKIKLV